jgi:hypothetical protein
MDNSPTALFHSYEQEFKQIVDSIREKLDGDGKDGRGGTPPSKAERQALCLTGDAQNSARRR